MSELFSLLCSKQRCSLVFAVMATERLAQCMLCAAAKLMHIAANRFMKDYDSRLDLAPRDIVARAIQDQMRTRDESHVLLDIR